MPTFSLYNPTSDTTAQLAGALLATNSGISIVSGSETLKYGTGTASDGAGSRSTTSVSFYDGSISQLGIGAGVLLTSGDAAPPRTNSSDDYSVSFDTPTPITDADLKAAVLSGFAFAGEIRDVTSLTFKFTVSDPSLTGVQFDLVFASDEYPEYVDSSFVDIGGVFINGKNYALFNGKENQPLSIIDKNMSAGGFRNNAASVIPIEYDGVSVKLTVAAPVVAGENTIKIAVGDTGDSRYDSGLFVSNLRAVKYSGTGLAKVLAGTAGADTLIGTNDNEVFDLGAGNDSAIGAGGDDLILGGPGIDSVIFSGRKQFFTIAKSGDSVTVKDNVGSGGTDTLVEVERLRFPDKWVAVDLGPGQSAGNTAKLIGAVFDTSFLTPEFVGTGIYLFDNGYTMEQVADLALGTELYVQLAGSRSNLDFVNLVYKNVVGVTPPPEDRDYFVSLLDSGSLTQPQLAVIAANAEVNAVNIDLVGLDARGIEFTPYA